jgi:hypothetical protein
VKNHYQRLLFILVATLTVVAALIAAVKLGAAGEITASLCTALGLLIPALLDASQVEKRRRTPGKKAVEDDVPPTESDAR